MSIRVVASLLAIVSLSFATVACGAWQPIKDPPAKCGMDRNWVEPAQDAEGNWQEGYCQWDEGRERRP